MGRHIGRYNVDHVLKMDCLLAMRFVGRRSVAKKERHCITGGVVKVREHPEILFAYLMRSVRTRRNRCSQHRAPDLAVYDRG